MTAKNRNDNFISADLRNLQIERDDLADQIFNDEEENKYQDELYYDYKKLSAKKNRVQLLNEPYQSIAKKNEILEPDIKYDDIYSDLVSKLATIDKEFSNKFKEK